MKRCARRSLRERARRFRAEGSLEPSLAAGARLSPSAGRIIASPQAGFDSRSSCGSCWDAAGRAVDALELPGPASRLLLGVLAASSPCADLNGLRVSKEALQPALSFARSRAV